MLDNRPVTIMEWKNEAKINVSANRHLGFRGPNVERKNVESSK